MPPGSGVIVEGTGNEKRENPNLEKMDQVVDIKIQIIFSSISYTKFLKQKNKSTKFITDKKGGSVSDYYLYCAEDWPAEAYKYNDPVDQVIFIDCGSDDFKTTQKNGDNEQALRKYTSFAIMRLKDMLYRRSKMHQRGQVHCQILSISPFQKCMMAMSALLGKVLSDSGIYFSFIADVGSRPEYRYTFNWIRSYGWKFEVYYNAVFRPFYARVECHDSPQLKLNEINTLVNGETRYKTGWGIFNRNDVYNSTWVDKKYKKDENGDVTLPWGEKANGEKRKVTFYNKKEKKTKVYKEEEEVTLTEWEPQEESTEVWVPSDPKVQKWQDPVSGKYLVKYNGQIYERDYLQDFYEHSAHPNDDELTNRIGETHEAYDQAVERETKTKERVAATREARDKEFTQEYIDKEVDNLVSKTGMSPEDAKAALAEQGFILQDTEGQDMYFHDGKMMSDEQLKELETAAEEATKKAKKDYDDAVKAKEIKDRNDYLFWLNMASLVVGVLSFGATTLALGVAFAVVDLAINVGVVYNQVQLATTQGGEWHDAFGNSIGEKALNMGLTGLAVIGDVLAFVPVFKAIKSPRALPHANPITKGSGRTRKVTNSKGETQWRTQVTREDGRVDVYTRDKDGKLLSVDSTNPQNPGEYTHSEQFHANGKPKSEDVIKDNQVTRTDYFDENGEFLESDININESNSSFDDIINGVDDYLGSKIGAKPNENIDVKGVNVNTGISLNGEKIHEPAFEVTTKSPNTSPEATVKGQQQPSGTKTEAPSAEPQPAAKDANNSSPSNTETAQTGSNTTDGYGGTNTSNDADTEIVKADNAAAEGKGTPSSNTGNGEKTVQEVKRSIWAEARNNYAEGMNYNFFDSDKQRLWKAFKENSGINHLPLVSKNGVKGWIKKDLISLGLAAAHWICVYVAGKTFLEDIGAIDKPRNDGIDIGDSIINQTVIDDGYSDVSQNNNGEIGNLVGVAPQSLDAEAIANDTNEQMDSLSNFGYNEDDDMYQDYSDMNTAANNVIAAENKVAAAKEYAKTGEEMERILKEHVEPGGDLDGEIPIEAFEDDWYVSLYDYRGYLAQNVLDPGNTSFDENSIVDIAEAELEGAQVDLLLQQVIQKDKDNKMKEDE